MIETIFLKDTANKMKKAFKILLLSLLFVIAFAVSVSAYDIAVKDAQGNEYYHTEYRLYLPSHISPSEVTFLVPDNNITYVDQAGNDVPFSNDTPLDITPFLSPYYTEPVYILTIKVDEAVKYLFIRMANSLPSLYVSFDTDVDTFLRYNMSNESTSATFLDKNGTIEFVDKDGLCEFKVRGNATEAYLKKPFQIKLPMKANLYNMGGAKTWLLLANYDDQSLIRNSIMYKLGEKLGMQTCHFRSIDLFINGEYYGIYLLCEKVQIGKNRLEITDLEDKNDDLNESYAFYSTNVTSGALIDSTNLSQYRYIANVTNPSDITGGYLVELDNNYYENELCYFTTDYGNHYVIKSPEYASREEVEYIATLFADMEEAIMSDSGYNSKGKHYSEYIDIDSFASAYIMQELGRNFDAGSSSLYFYKDVDVNGVTSKIYKGPLWDCDNTLGNIHKNGASSTEGYWARNRSIWAGLTNKSEFNALVSEKFTSLYDCIFDMIDCGGFIDQEVAIIGDSIYMEQYRYGSNDYEKWPLYYDGTHYDKWQSSQVFNFCSIYSQGNNEDDTTVIGYLCEHIENRTNWLANEWDCDVVIRERQLTKPIEPEPPIEPDEPDTPEVPDTPVEPEPPITSDSDTSADTNTETDSSTSTDTNIDVETDTSTSTDTNTDTSISTDTNIETSTDTETSAEVVAETKQKNIFEAIWEFIKELFERLISIFE